MKPAPSPEDNDALLANLVNSLDDDIYENECLPLPEIKKELNDKNINVDGLIKRVKKATGTEDELTYEERVPQLNLVDKIKRILFDRHFVLNIVKYSFFILLFFIPFNIFIWTPTIGDLEYRLTQKNDQLMLLNEQIGALREYLTVSDSSVKRNVASDQTPIVSPDTELLAKQSNLINDLQTLNEYKEDKIVILSNQINRLQSNIDNLTNKNEEYDSKLTAYNRKIENEINLTNEKYDELKKGAENLYLSAQQQRMDMEILNIKKLYQTSQIRSVLLGLKEKLEYTFTSDPELSKAATKEMALTRELHQLVSQLIYYYQNEQYERAIPVLDQFLSKYQHYQGADNLEVAIFFAEFAGLYEEIGNYAKAENLYIQTLKIQEDKFGTEHYYTIALLDNLAKLYEKMEDPEKSEFINNHILKLQSGNSEDRQQIKDDSKSFFSKIYGNGESQRK